MVSKRILRALRSALGVLETRWQIASGHVEKQSFTVIRYDSTISKGEMAKLHARIETLLTEELGD